MVLARRNSWIIVFGTFDSRSTIHVFLFLPAVIFLGIRLAGVIIYPEEEFQFARQKSSRLSVVANHRVLLKAMRLAFGSIARFAFGTNRALLRVNQV